VANARLSAGKASQGDVLLGTLELSRLSERRLTLRQQVASTKAKLNRLLGRSADHPVDLPQDLNVSLPDWSAPMLQQLAMQHQPEISAAVLRRQAADWGVTAARLQRRPDVALSASWFAIDDNRPTPNVVDVGEDAWSVGVQVSVPLWYHKNNAQEHEARHRDLAAFARVDAALSRYDALLRDLWEQAKAADETAKLYRATILPQARQTFKADQQAYGTGAVEFDRVIRDLRTVLTLQLELHRAEGRLATALARIRQAVGVDLAGEGARHENVPAPLPLPPAGD